MAHLLGITPSHLCYVEEGGGLKGKGSPSFPAHRDEDDVGRIQCIVALSDVGFDVWPYSNALPSKKGDVHGDGHFHFSNEFKRDLEANCERVVFSAKAGDVFILEGGLTVHGVPEVGENNPTRVVTYATFWPPGTTQGNLHAKGRCTCRQTHP